MTNNVFRKPGKFYQYQLDGLGYGDNKIYQGGCMTTNPIGTLSARCVEKGLSFPNNGEYSAYVNTTKDINNPYYNCNQCKWRDGCGDEGGNGSTDDCGVCAAGCEPNCVEPGYRCGVQRIAFNGDPGSCLLLSTSGYLYPKSTGNSIKTPREQIGLNSVVGDRYSTDVVFTCQNPIDYKTGGYSTSPTFLCNRFLGNKISDKNTKKAWIQGKPTGPGDVQGLCYNYVDQSPSVLNDNGETSKAILKDALTTLHLKGVKLNDPEYTQIYNNMLQQCNKYPGACDIPLADIVKQYTRKDVYTAYNNYLKDNTDIGSQNIYMAAGCFLPASQYTEWSNLGVSEINVSCDPLCMLPLVIPRTENGQIAKCDQSVCIIDNITVDVVNSTTGDINFNTVCGNCPNGNCRCIFDNINVFSSGSSVGKINFNQNCGSCAIPNPNVQGDFIPVSCKVGPEPTPVINIFEKIKQWLIAHKLFLIVFIALVILLIGILVMWKFYGNKKKTAKSLSEQITLKDLYGPEIDDILAYY